MTGDPQAAPAPEWTGLRTYCLHCMTGYEARTADRIRLRYEGVDAYAVLQEKHLSRMGRKSLTTGVMLPGYVFVYAREDPPFRELLSLENVIRFLSYGGEDGFSLKGADLDFSRWIWRHRGMLACSRAAAVGSRLCVVEGPLADRMGTVLKVDRHNRNVCLGIDFDGSVRRVWLPFVWTGEPGGTKILDGCLL